jgi:translocation and assembly module TamB
MNWKRFGGWTIAGLAGVIFIAAIGGYVYLKSTSFEHFALNKIEQAASTATGAKTQIGRLDFNLSTLTAHLYDITLHGTEAPGQPPLLHADKLTVSARIVSALRRQISLGELLIEHPVIHVQVSRSGRNNLPSAPPSQKASHTSVFDLAITHAQITNGEIDYNDRKTPLEADLYDLGTDIHFVPTAKRYDGELSYSSGQIRYAKYAPLPHTLNVRFSASPEQFGLESAVFRIGSSEVILHAALSNFSNPVADGDYRIAIHTQDFAQWSSGTAPKGDVLLGGSMHYQELGSQPLLRCVSVNGEFASDVLTAAISGSKIDLRKLQGTYQLAGGRLQVKNLSVESLGGRITAAVDIKDLDTTPDSRVQAGLHDISLRALQQSLREKGLNTASVSGQLNGTAEAAWKGSINHNLRAKSDLTVLARASSRSNPSASEVPVEGAIHVNYDAARQTIAVRQTSLRIPSATVSAQGEVSDHSNLQVRLVATNLHQLAALAASFSRNSTTPPAVSGSATVNALVNGSMKRPTIAGELSAQNLQVEGSQWSSVKFRVQADPSEFTIEHGSLINAQQGQATFSAGVALHNWSYEPADAIKATLNVQQLRLLDLQRMANQHYPISGDLSARFSVEGSQLNPIGSGSAQITNARAYDEPIQNFALHLAAANGSISSTLKVSTAAGDIDTNLSFTPKTKAYKVRLDAPSLVLQKLQTVRTKSLELTGTLNASVGGEGTLDDPQLVAIMQLPQLQVQQKSIAGLKAEIHMTNHALDLNLDSKVSEASVRAHGHVALTGDYYTETAVDTSNIPLDVLMATHAKGAPQGFSGQTEFHAILKGPLKDASRVEAHLSIPILRASYQSLNIGIADPVRVDYANSVVTLQPAEIRGTGTSVKIQGRVPIGGQGPTTLAAQGSIDMRILKVVAPDVQSSGLVALDVRSSGSAEKPVIQGQVQLKDVALTTSDAPIGVEKLNGTLDITNDHLQVSKMTALMGGGQVSLSGSVAYEPSLQFNLALQGRTVRLLYPDGLRALLDANLSFNGTTEASTLNGRVLIDSLSFTPDFDLAKFGDQFSTGTTTPSQPRFADTVKLAIGVQSQESLSASSSQVSLAGQVAVQVGGTAANPVITGRTNLTSGELFYRNLRYELQNGAITFDDPNETHPVMNVSVTTTVEQYNLTLSMRGPLDKLTTSYVSDPPLATADIINLVARGKTTQESAASSQSTDSMIASQATSELSSGVQKLAGLSSLEIDPTMGGNNQNPSARVAIQQRVTKNLLFTFSTDVSQPGSEIVQGEYQLNKRWSVSMSRDQLGGVSVDGKYRKNF